MFQLSPNLSGQAQLAFAAMDQKDAGDYEKLKKAILRRYDVTPEAYRERFRSARKKGDESYTKLMTRLSDLAQKWTRSHQSSVEQLLEIIVYEQFENAIDLGLRVFLRERQPKDVTTAAELADNQGRTG